MELALLVPSMQHWFKSTTLAPDLHFVSFSINFDKLKNELQPRLMKVRFILSVLKLIVVIISGKLLALKSPCGFTFTHKSKIKKKKIKNIEKKIPSLLALNLTLC